MKSVTVLTPPGQGAVAVLRLRGPDLWPILRQHFRSFQGKQLPATFSKPHFWIGRFGLQTSDEILLAALHSEAFEIHCHGGQQVVAFILDLLKQHDVRECDGELGQAQPEQLLPFARTVRTASILLDQASGAYRDALAAIAQNSTNSATLQQTLRCNAAVGRHLIEPWRVTLAGAPNSGKSSLMNALAGFNRTIVSPVAGTTRDAVSQVLAFDGWPIELTDTAGLRTATDEIEREGVSRAKTAIKESDLCLYLVDATTDELIDSLKIAEQLELDPNRLLILLNKIDVSEQSFDHLPEAIRVSAKTGKGLKTMIARIVQTLVPNPPKPGEPVPYTSELCDLWS